MYHGPSNLGNQSSVLNKMYSSVTRSDQAHQDSDEEAQDAIHSESIIPRYGLDSSDAKGRITPRSTVGCHVYKRQASFVYPYVTHCRLTKRNE